MDLFLIVIKRWVKPQYRFHRCSMYRFRYPKIISYSSKQKGGVNTFDQKNSKSSSSCRTRRWPHCIFYQMLDISVVNSYIIHQCYKNNQNISAEISLSKETSISFSKATYGKTYEKYSPDVRIAISHRSEFTYFFPKFFLKNKKTFCSRNVNAVTYFHHQNTEW